MKHRVFLTAAISALALAACAEDAEVGNEVAETENAAMGTAGQTAGDLPAPLRNAALPAGEGQAFLDALAAEENAQATESGLVLQTLREGEGASPDQNDLVKINFVARVAGSEEPFESSYDSGYPVVLNLASTLPGWSEAVQLMQEGGIARAGVPASLAFGEQGMPGGPVGPNQVTVYDLELVDVYDVTDDAALKALADEAQGNIQELTQRAQEQQNLAQQQFAALSTANRARSNLYIQSQAERPETQVTDSGLVYEPVSDEGEGPSPSLGDTVTVNYRGTLPNGEVFDSSYQRGEPAQFQLGQVIEGWNQGLQLMNVGDTYRFYIPGDLAYGQQGTRGGPIGPNQALAFEVELLEVTEGAPAQEAEGAGE